MEFSRQEHCSGLPCPPPGAGERPDPGLKPTSSAAPALQADFLPLSRQGSPLKEYIYIHTNIHTLFIYKTDLLKNTCQCFFYTED